MADRALTTLRVGAGREARLDAHGLVELPAALRGRVIRRWLLDGGAGGLTGGQIRAVDRLAADRRGRGGVAVGSAVRRQRLFADRAGPALIMRTEPV